MFRKSLLFILFMVSTLIAVAQSVMTPELMWKLKRVSFVAQSPEGSKIVYRTTVYDFDNNKNITEWFIYDIRTQTKNQWHNFDKSFITWHKEGIYARSGNTLYKSQDMGQTWGAVTTLPEGAMDIQIANNGRWIAYSMEVPAQIKTRGKDIHPDMPNTTARIYNNLDYRHWDTWHEGMVNHVFVRNLDKPGVDVDILQGTDYNTPQKPFGGAEDFIFSPDNTTLIYVCKKKVGKEYALSTNTDIYAYDLNTGKTTNLSKGMMGYDVNPQFNSDGTLLAWLSMERDGYEADKNDLVVMDWRTKQISNRTRKFDMTIDGGFIWSHDNQTLFYNATREARTQAFWVNAVKSNPFNNWSDYQLCFGDYDIQSIHGQYQDYLIVTRTDFNHAAELFLLNLNSGKFTPISEANDDIYNSIALSKVEMRIVKTTHGHDMGVWVIYPPNFNPNKKYPTLLYCQGGPQGAVSQFYSFRWNFQLMAAQGYIVVAPNRTGLPGYGVAWNEAISGDWGGQPMEDYLAAIDELAKEPYVDENRLGAVGASYGGYSVFMLAGIHQNRFKTFIAHCGLFNMRSWYGTTEEMWFANWDLGGSYWQKNPPKAYTLFDPSSYVQYWNTPIMIIQGEKDFRVPIGQGQEAFQAAQLRGIKSRFIVFPDENHWVLKPQNSIVWHREFFKWLKETL